MRTTFGEVLAGAVTHILAGINEMAHQRNRRNDDSDVLCAHHSISNLVNKMLRRSQSCATGTILVLTMDEETYGLWGYVEWLRKNDKDRFQRETGCVEQWDLKPLGDAQLDARGNWRQRFTVIKKKEPSRI